MTNKFNGANYMTKTSGNDVHNMPKTPMPEAKHYGSKSVTVTKASPRSDTENVKITRDTVTNAVFGRE